MHKTHKACSQHAKHNRLQKTVLAALKIPEEICRHFCHQFRGKKRSLVIELEKTMGKFAVKCQ